MKKEFKTIEEQVEILKRKGLIIEDEEETKEILLRENYFFINGYRLLLMNSYSDKTFVKGSTFKELYALFLFDRSMRNIIFKYLLIIENQLKSITSYQLSKKYGYQEKDYLNPKNFTEDRSKIRRVKDLIEKMIPNVEYTIDEIGWYAKEKCTLEGEDLEVFERLLNLLDDIDDVTEVYHNVNL